MISLLIFKNLLKERMKKENLPKVIPIFPLSNFIIFPETTVPLNIFEPRYIEMINDSMKTNKMIGLIQPKKNSDNSTPDLHDVGCLGKIISFNETEDGRYLIVLNGLNRFKIVDEKKSNKLYRECQVTYKDFEDDVTLKNKDIKFSDLQFIFQDLKNLFQKKGYIINWKELEKQSLDQTINALAMASPFSLEEKQILLETQDVKSRKIKFEEILNTYNVDDFSNTTIQ
jgi:Lon protease-like protein|tara:strand:- start:1340 stop:2023 length:684 start_codon:yes stop_codon:yes gene_type:complete